MTVNEIMKHFKDKYKVKISMLTVGEKAIYNEYANKDMMKGRLSEKIESIYNQLFKKTSDEKYILLDVGGATVPDQVDVSMPKIKYSF
mmetsp:Transcript_25166/g.28985  ORF Transcript_25166/g.28985 Transcript_25166/m.28985 type:complete len:88 (+) Transcript_25166:2825-3088(+)